MSSELAGESEPWKDEETLQRLYHEEGLDQSEIGDELGTTGSTISYWMQKFGVNTSHTSHQRATESGLKCDYYEVCGNESPTPNNGCCDECLDLFRINSREQNIDITEFDSVTEYVRRLHDEA